MDDEFKNIEDVKIFLRHGNDITKQKIIQSYINTFNIQLEDIDVTELNGFVEYEHSSFYQGYEEYTS
jgi:hypothetical protein|tara:strand:- start:4125 stop:4325 length:201 start_codon:yes stop_codon:yes gene_type:complete